MAEEKVVFFKLSIFWPTQSEVWFAQAEAQFNLCKIIIYDTKYYHVLAALDQATATHLLDLINKPPRNIKYEALNDCLIAILGLTQK